MTKDSLKISAQSPQVVVVEASAGSGKTYALAKRYLGLLLNPTSLKEKINLRNILAITFTNKAMLSMKERILDFLKKLALDSFDKKEEEKDILDFLGLDKDQASKRSRHAIELIIKNYNFFQVQTIDSFINAVLLGCALYIDRSGSFSIKKDYIDHIAYCFDLIVDQAEGDARIQDFMKEFLEHYLFVENRTGWFPREDILLLIQSLFRLSNKHGKELVGYEGESLDVIKMKKSVFLQIEELSQEIPPGFNANARRSLESFLAKNKSIFDISKLPSYFKSDQSPMNKGKAGSINLDKKWESLSVKSKT